MYVSIVLQSVNAFCVKQDARCGSGELSVLKFVMCICVLDMWEGRIESQPVLS